MSHHNDAQLFKKLSAVKLRSLAHDWAELHAFIRRISLYPKPIGSDFDFRVKYVVYFEMSDISKADGYGYNEYDKKRRKILIENDKTWIKTLEGPNGLISALATTENAFKEIYKNNPKDNFMDEWCFVTKLPERVVDEFSWLLFSHSNIEKQSSPSSENIKENFNTTILTENINGISKKNHENCFSLSGDYWEVTYKGEKTTIRNLERIRYIIHLLDNPGKEIPCHHLTSNVKRNKLPPNQDLDELNEEQLRNEGLIQDESLIEGLSKEDFEETKKVALIVWEHHITSSSDDKARTDWENCKNLLQDQYGIVVNDSGNKPVFVKKERLRKEVEKTRSNVSKQISAAIKDIEKKLPLLAKHLNKEIKKGSICTYPNNEDNLINWNIKW